MQGGLDKLAGAAATVDALSQDAQQQRIQLRASQVRVKLMHCCLISQQIVYVVTALY